MAIAFFQRNMKIEYILIIAYFHDNLDYDINKKQQIKSPSGNHKFLIYFDVWSIFLYEVPQQWNILVYKMQFLVLFGNNLNYT